MTLRADLHNHSCLSPCGSLELSPARLVREAKAAGIGVLALTDHNSALNAPAFGALCRKAGILPVFGLEATTMEEIHALCLFGTEHEALEFGEELYELLPEIPNDPELFGDQVWVDEQERILGEVEKTLTSAAAIGLDELAGTVLSRGGLFVPAHVDREIFSLTSQLGFIPEGKYSAIEITRLPCPPHPGTYPCITGSDAHYPEDVGKRPFEVTLPEPSFAALRDALAAGRVSLPAPGRDRRPRL